MVGEMRDLDAIGQRSRRPRRGFGIPGRSHDGSGARDPTGSSARFPQEQQEQIRARLSTSVVAVDLARCCCRGPRSAGVIAAFEIMLMTPRSEHLIARTRRTRIIQRDQTGAKRGCSCSTTTCSTCSSRRRSPTGHDGGGAAAARPPAKKVMEYSRGAAGPEK